jgi:Ankyrin repeats (3 copies)
VSGGRFAQFLSATESAKRVYIVDLPRVHEGMEEWCGVRVWDGDKCGACAVSRTNRGTMAASLDSSVSVVPAEADITAGEGGSACVAEDGGGEWVSLSEEARLVLFWGCGEHSRFQWVENVAKDVAEGKRSVDAEEVRAVAVKGWTGDSHMSCRYGRDMVRSQTSLRVLLDCTDVVWVVAEYLGVRKVSEAGVSACLCVGAFGGDRAMVEVASSVLCGTVGVVHRRLSVECEGKCLAWWAGAGGHGALFREVVWGAGGGSVSLERGASGTGAHSSSLSSEVIISALEGAACGGMVDECRRGLDALGGLDASAELRRKGVVEALLYGARRGRVEVVEWAVGVAEKEEGMDVQAAKDANGMTALHWAAQEGRVLVVENLVSLCGARLDVNAKDVQGRTALHCAASQGHRSVVERLVALAGDRLDVNAKDGGRRTPLICAAKTDDASVVEKLVTMCGGRLDVNVARGFEFTKPTSRDPIKGRERV